MPKQKLTCRCGHSWEHSATGPVPSDVSAICPICTAANQHTVEHSATSEVPGSTGADTLKSGQVLAGFEILEELNRGGMGVIYKARQQGLNRLVALKVISPERLGNPDAMKRFQREVQAAALLSHPNIVTVFHTDLEGPRPYLAMEYVSGIDLSRLVKRAGQRSVQDACFYVRETALGLQHAFEQRLVHRDIKPANLMVTPSPLDTPPSTRKPTVKILDMGLARVTNAEDVSEAVSGLTQAGEFLGTPDYIAPEQAEDPRQADIRSDLYSLGGTLYFLLAGEVPYPGTSLMQKLRRQISGPLPSLAGRRPDAPPELDDLIKKLMAREPKERYQTPVELIEALDYITGKRGSGRPVSEGRGVRGAGRGTAPSAPATIPAGANLAASIHAHTGGVRALSLSADGKLLLSGGQDETLRLWDVGRLQEVRCVAGDVGPVEDVYLAPGAKWAVSCALRLFKPDMVVQCWELASGSERRRLRGHSDNIYCVAIAPDGRRVAAGSADQTIRIWTLDQSGVPAICLRGHADRVSSVMFLPNDSFLSGGHDGLVRLWDSKTGWAKGSLNPHVGKIEMVTFCGKRMGIAGSKGLRVRQANGSLTAMNGHAGPVLCAVFSPDSQFLLSGGSDGSVRLWRAEDGHELHCFQEHADKVHAVVFAPDGRTAFSGSDDGTIRRWLLP